MIHGVPDGQWLQAKAQARAILIERARMQDPISYSDLAAHITDVNFDARDLRLYRMLEELSRDEHKEGRGLLSAIVVHKGGDQRPGQGFLELAKEVGRDHKDPLYWEKELMRVYSDWPRR